MGCGSIFYTGHITSFAKRGKRSLQKQFYDDIFADVPTRYLHLMIRPDHEPENDNDDPYEPDWPHTQPSYCLTPQRHAELFATVAAYLDTMAKRFPRVLKPKLVAPNVLSAVDAAKRYLPETLKLAAQRIRRLSAGRLRDEFKPREMVSYVIQRY